MSTGFVLECGPQGADQQVCEHLARLLRPGRQIVSRTMDNKRKLFADAASVAKLLLAQGCTKVLIVWDLRPAWPDTKDKPCRARERQTLLAALAREGLAGAPVHLVCVEQELESWLLACDHAISAFLSTPAHPYRATKVRKPDRVPDPKAAMNKHFNAARGTRYEDRSQGAPGAPAPRRRCLPGGAARLRRGRAGRP